jgi:hypothetical protein
MTRKKEFLGALGCVAVLLGLWELMVRFLRLPPYVLPSPSQIFLCFGRDLPLLLYHAEVTLVEVGLGLGIGVLLGIGIAVLAFYVRPVGRALTPFLVGSQVIPVFAVAPLFVLWFGFGIWPKVAVAAMIVFFPVAVNFLDGLRGPGPGTSGVLPGFRNSGAPHFSDGESSGSVTVSLFRVAGGRNLGFGGSHCRGMGWRKPRPRLPHDPGQCQTAPGQSLCRYPRPHPFGSGFVLGSGTM